MQSPKPGPGPGPGTGPKTGPGHGQRPNAESTRSALKAQIDENLKRAYETVLHEEIPDRFKDLLAQLKARDGQK